VELVELKRVALRNLFIDIAIFFLSVAILVDLFKEGNA